jgi:ribonucleoside-diphosphate reductase alpha chain
VLNRQESSKRGSATALSTEKQSIKELPYKRLGATVSMKTPSGTAHITMNHDCEGQPFEVFIEIGKGGSDLKAMAEAIGRLISLIFRLEPIPPKERAREIIEQLNGIGGARFVGFGKNKVLSLPDAISKALAEHYELKLNLDAASYKNNPDIQDGVDGIASFLATTHFRADICPVCGQSSYVREEGCTHCLSCGFSEC